MATADEILGFGDALAINFDVNDFLKEVNTAASERGIILNEPSDALDMSRDVILDEAAARCSVRWEIIDRTMCLTPTSLRFDWKAYIEAEADAEIVEDES